MSMRKLDLGSVRGPQGETGPAGPAGADGRTMKIGSGEPADDTGYADGDVYLDKDTGTFYELVEGAWAIQAQFATEGAVVDDDIDAGSENPVQNKAIAAALDKKAPDVHEHSISDVTGLTEALHGKVDASDIGYDHSENAVGTIYFDRIGRIVHFLFRHTSFSGTLNSSSFPNAFTTSEGQQPLMSTYMFGFISQTASSPFWPAAFRLDSNGFLHFIQAWVNGDAASSIRLTSGRIYVCTTYLSKSA